MERRFFPLLITFFILHNGILGIYGKTTNGTSTIEMPIKFPGPIQELTNKYGEEDEEPEECRGKTFCTVKPPDYPQEEFDKLFKGQKQVPQITLVPEESFDNRLGDPSETDGCDVKISYEPLYRVRGSRDAEWRVVVQSPSENFVQRVRLEECREPKQKCFPIAADLGIETFCKQKYNVWEVLVSVGNGTTERIKAQLPICCSCHYRL